MSNQDQTTQTNKSESNISINKLMLMLLIGISPHIEPLISMTAATWKSVVTSAVLSIISMLIAYFSNPSSPVISFPQIAKK